jgi:hypothetical protein
MADTNRTRLAYILEETPGTTPAGNLRTMPRTGGAINPNQEGIRSEIIRDDLKTGQPVRTSQTGGGGINYELRYGDLDDIFRGILLEDWETNVLVDGTDRVTFTFEEQHLDVDQYLVYRFCMISSLSLSLQLQAIATGSFDVLATSVELNQASLGTTDPAPGSESMNTVDMVTSVEEGGVSIGGITGVDLNLARNLRLQMEIGQLSARGIGLGALTIEGSIDRYFEDETQVDQFLAYSTRSLDVEFTDEAGNKIHLEVPNLKYTGEATIDKPGTDSDVIASIPFEAFGEAEDMIRITRTPAT